MTREEQLFFCKKCIHRKMDMQQGLICNLTSQKATFQNECSDFKHDETVKEFKGLELRPNGKRAKILLIFIWIVLGLEVIGILSSILQYNLLQIVTNGGTITSEEAEINDLREQIIGVIYLVAYIISGITFIMWFRRAYFNLHQRLNYLTFSEGWAAGSWFVPILNFFRPFQIMKELYVETKKYLNKKNDTLQLDLSTKFLSLWWILWIIYGILGQIIFRLSGNAYTINELTTLTILNIIGGLVGVGLSNVTLIVINDYSKVEKLLLLDDEKNPTKTDI